MSSSSKINSIINLRVLNQFDSFLRCLRSKVPSANLKQGLRIGHILYLISQSDSQLFRSRPLLRRKLTDKPQQTNKPGNSKLHILHIAPYCLHCKESDCLIGRAQWDLSRKVNLKLEELAHMFSYVKLNFNLGLFFSTFWFEHSLRSENAYL